ncbi:MAG: transposase, partial [Gammaproteobacteria bacterium]
RVFDEHFVVEKSALRPKKGEELTADSLQSPDDWEATYRHKSGKDYIGYVANVTETSTPENPFQLIVKVQAESNNTDDAAMLAEVLPELKERTRQPEKTGLHDFDWQVDEEAHPQSVQCPHQQRVDVERGRKSHRYLARFDATVCETCPLADQCPTQPLKQRPERVLRFSQQDLNCAMRRQRCTAARAGPHNHRAAVEATVRAVKHPFRNGKVPVRGKPRVSMVLVGSAAMNNARQIHRYLVRQRADAAKKAKEYAQGSLLVSFLAALPARLSAQFRSLHLPRPVWACQT